MVVPKAVDDETIFKAATFRQDGRFPVLSYYHKENTVSNGRLFHAPTRTTYSGCFMLHRTVHALWNLYGNPYRNRAETEEETVT